MMLFLLPENIISGLLRITAIVWVLNTKASTQEHLVIFLPVVFILLIILLQEKEALF